MSETAEHHPDSSATEPSPELRTGTPESLPIDLGFTHYATIEDSLGETIIYQIPIAFDFYDGSEFAFKGGVARDELARVLGIDHPPVTDVDTINGVIAPSAYERSRDGGVRSRLVMRALRLTAERLHQGGHAELALSPEQINEVSAFSLALQFSRAFQKGAGMEYMGLCHEFGLIPDHLQSEVELFHWLEKELAYEGARFRFDLDIAAQFGTTDEGIDKDDDAIPNDSWEMTSAKFRHRDKLVRDKRINPRDISSTL